MEWIAGVDEAGRGPLAGPVVAAAVILPSSKQFDSLQDSKALSPQRRDYWHDEILTHCVCYGVGQASVAEIDQMNILQATLLAMRRAVNQLTQAPSLVCVDGNQDPRLLYPTQLIVRGDETEPVIAAASILAKVTRDRLMQKLDKKYPGYGFASHKGYGTKQHLAALRALGPTPCHRRSFQPVADCWLNV